MACLSGINNNKLNDFIQKCRGKTNITNCDNDNILKTIININLLEPETTPSTFLNNFNNKVLSIIYELISVLNVYKVKTRKYKPKNLKKKLTKKK